MLQLTPHAVLGLSHIREDEHVSCTWGSASLPLLGPPTTKLHSNCCNIGEWRESTENVSKKIPRGCVRSALTFARRPAPKWTPGERSCTSTTNRQVSGAAQAGTEQTPRKYLSVDAENVLWHRPRDMHSSLFLVFKASATNTMNTPGASVRSSSTATKRARSSSPCRDENKVEGGRARPYGGQAQRPQPPDVPGVHQGQARVDQHRAEGGEGQRKDLLVEDVGFGDPHDGGVELLLRSGPLPDARCWRLPNTVTRDNQTRYIADKGKDRQKSLLSSWVYRGESTPNQERRPRFCLPCDLRSMYEVYIVRSTSMRFRKSL